MRSPGRCSRSSCRSRGCALAPDALSHPFSDSRLGGRAVIESLAPSAAGTGASPGDFVLEVNGVSYLLQQRQGNDWLRAGVPNVYLLEKRDGRASRSRCRRFRAPRCALPAESMFHALLLVVAMIYLVTGGAVWWMRPDRAGAWALLLFCSTMAVQLATVIQTDDIRVVVPRLMFNLPLIGATTFHLFTSYPDRAGLDRAAPPHPGAALSRLRSCSAASRSRITCSDCARGPARSLALAYTLGLFVVSLAIVGIERHRHREGALRDHADVVFLGALVSFLPALVGLVAELLFADPVPVLPAAALGLRLSARRRLRDRAAPALRGAQPREVVRRLRRRVARHHRRASPSPSPSRIRSSRASA